MLENAKAVVGAPMRVRGEQVPKRLASGGGVYPFLFLFIFIFIFYFQKKKQRKNMVWPKKGNFFFFFFFNNI